MADKAPGAFGDRMKSYERTTKHILSPRTFTIVRVDGRAFHTYLRKADKPFDETVIDAMDATAVALCDAMAGVRFAYTQSDEISILLTDLDPKTQPWFGGEIQKIASVSASIATMAFNRYHPGFDTDRLGRSATFDSRVYTIPSRIEVASYFLWRQQDAISNAVSMAAEAHIPSRQLMGVSVAQRQELLFERGINFKTAYSDRIRRGGVVIRETYRVESQTLYQGEPVPRSRVLPRALPTIRRRWAAKASPDFTLDNGGFLAENIPVEPSDALQPAPGCPHEAWEESTSGHPSKCSDCGHRFTQRESDERRGWQS